jgi:DnaJ-class molecular chaperone
MSEPQLLRLREEYRRAARHKLEIESSIKDLEHRLELIGKLQNSLRNGESSNELQTNLKIRARSNLSLNYKVVGLKKQTEASLIDRKAEAQKVTATLTSLELCPRCSGLGRLSNSTRYERLQEGPIIPVLSSSKCDLCSGSGRLPLHSKDTLD